jgi:hypothetical protein
MERAVMGREALALRALSGGAGPEGLRKNAVGNARTV